MSSQHAAQYVDLLGVRQRPLAIDHVPYQLDPSSLRFQRCRPWILSVTVDNKAGTSATTSYAAAPARPPARGNSPTAGKRLRRRATCSHR
jgi:hypothetical protein